MQADGGYRTTPASADLQGGGSTAPGPVMRRPGVPMDRATQAAESPGARAPDYYIPGPQGLAFRDGKLYDFGPDRLVVLRGGPCPAAWVKGTAAAGRPGWFSSRVIADEVLRGVLMQHAALNRHTPCRLDGETPVCADGQQLLPFSRRFYTREIAISCFVATIPTPFLSSLRAVPEGAWQLSAFLARCGSAAPELAESHLPLAFALAHAERFRPVTRPLRSARRLLAAKRTAICAWLGFPGEPSAVRLLGRVPSESLTVRRLWHLRRLLFENDPETMTLLRHAPTLRGEVLDAFTAFRPALTPGLVRDLADSGTAMAVRYMLGRLSPMLSELGRSLLPIRDVAGLRRLLEQTERDWHRHNLRRSLPEALPPPPLAPPPGSGIQALTTLSDLLDEGEAQRNCCAAYAARMVAGTDYVYRVTAPVRATLSITRGSDGSWGPGDLRLAWNRPVTAEIWESVFRVLLDAAGRGSADGPEDWPADEPREWLTNGPDDPAPPF